MLKPEKCKTKTKLNEPKCVETRPIEHEIKMCLLAMEGSTKTIRESES